MTAWDVEDIADGVVDQLMTKAGETMTAEQRVEFLMYLTELIDCALQLSLSVVRKH